MGDGLKVCADTKCKLEKTDLSENTIFETLRGAIPQLPRSEPCFIFLKSPHNWVGREALPGFHETMKAAIERFFRAYQRVISVKLFFCPIIFDGTTMLSADVIEEFISHNHRFDQERDWHIFTGDDIGVNPSQWQTRIPNWRRLVDV
jgi:hypothetical protein